MKQFALFPVAAILAGCAASQVPIPTAHPISYQKKAMAAHHWDVLANDVAEQAVATVGKDPSLRQYPLYVTPPRENTTFNRAFRDLVITRLVERGFDVRASNTGGLEVSSETQFVYHPSDRQLYFPETLTAVAGPPTKTEVIVTTSISQGGRYLMRRTEIYYIEGTDHLLFVEQRSAPGVVRNWKVVGEQ